MIRCDVRVLLLSAACAALTSIGASRLAAQTADSLPQFERSEQMIPMRDGVRLHTVIFRPAGATEPLPILLTRTPYGVDGSERTLQLAYGELARDGYIFAFQDIRGRFGSEGQFVMNRPLHAPRDTAGVDESTDTYDTIDWLVKQTPGTNGRVGVLGISYPGWLAGMAGIHPHPALKAISPQAPMTDTWMGDDFFHQGAFRLSYGFEYSADLELSKDQSIPPPIPYYDTYRWYLEQGPLANLSKLLAGRAPTWTNFAAHPAYDTLWQARALTTYLTTLEVPTLTVGGFWDQEDFFGPLATYAALERHDTAGMNYLVLGPWNHGGWARSDGSKLGNIDFGAPTGRYFRERIQAPWFAYWLKGKGIRDFGEARVFEAGSGTWRTYDHWPSKEAVRRSLYLHGDGRLGFDAPAKRAAAFDQYLSDPARPVPYRLQPVQRTYDPRGSGWYTWLTDDQRFVDGRPDVLAWRTEVLPEDVTIAGDVIARLFASTTGTDADWAVKLIDVYPEDVKDDPTMSGYELMVAADIMRGRYRRSFARPAPLTPNAVDSFVVDLHQQAYRFRKGHRIMVQVQSTWFPVYDRNPQTYVPNIFEAKASDFRAQTHRVWRTARYPSHIELMVMPR